MKLNRIRVPNLSLPSVYHSVIRMNFLCSIFDPITIPSKFLGKTTRQLGNGQVLVTGQPFQLSWPKRLFENVNIEALNKFQFSFKIIKPQEAPIQSELSESALSKLESEYTIVEEQFKPCLDTINNEKRFNIIRYLLKMFYSRLNLQASTKLSKLYFCEMCLK